MIGGMITAVVLAVFFVPIFFVVVRRVFKGSERQRERYAEHARAAGVGGHEAVPATPANEGKTHG